MVAVINGTAQTYAVRRVWYHPGVMRELDDHFYVHSNDPHDGPINHRGPDVAVLQLSEEGPDLAAGLELASEAEINDLQDQAIGHLGYPVSSIDAWPTESRPVAASFATCVIGMMTDFAGNDGQATGSPLRQFLRFDSEAADGNSGSPMFLSNGHVVGLVMGMDRYPGHPYPDRAFRIDCVSETLAYHKLDHAKFAGKQRSRAEKGWGPDPRLDLLRKAVRLVHEADDLRKARQYAAALAKCNQALEIAPNDFGAYLQRSKVYLYELGTRFQELTFEQRVTYANAAYADSLRCAEEDPHWIAARNIHWQNIVYGAAIMGLPDFFRVTLESTSAWLKGSAGIQQF